MAGAGIGLCVGCGLDGQAVVNDLCPACIERDFWAMIEENKRLTVFESVVNKFEKIFWECWPVLFADALAGSVSARRAIDGAMYFEKSPDYDHFDEWTLLFRGWLNIKLALLGSPVPK